MGRPQHLLTKVTFCKESIWPSPAEAGRVAALPHAQELPGPLGGAHATSLSSKSRHWVHVEIEGAVRAHTYARESKAQALARWAKWQLKSGL